MERNPFAPYPNWVDPRGQDAPRYKVIDSNKLPDNQAFVDKDSGLMAVPFDKEGSVIAQHEMGHVMWSPVKVPKTNARFPRAEKECYATLEEARIGMGMEAIGCPLKYRDGGEHTKHFQANIHAANVGMGVNPRIAVLNAITTFGTDYEEETLHSLQFLGAGRDAEFVCNLVGDARRMLDKAFRKANGTVPSDRTMRKMATWLERRLGILQREGERYDGTKGKPTDKPMGNDSGMAPLGKPKPSDEDIANATAETAPPKANQPNPNLKQFDFGQEWGGFGGRDSQTYGKPLAYTYNGFSGPLNSEAKPGSMSIEEPPRPMRCDELTRHRKRTHVDCDEGSKLGNITRIITDQRIFQRKLKKRKGGGTVLFDMSGSMGVLTEIIDEVISNNKTATTCATYSGRSSTGVLRIIVKEGRRVLPDQMGPPSGHNNVVDIPALDWLTRQPAPRVWVSDQCVTGVVDGAGSAYGNRLLLEAAHKMCESFNITVLESPRDVADHLKQCWEGEKASGLNPNAYEDKE